MDTPADIETVMWWLEQNDEARKELYAPSSLPTDHFKALAGFAKWMHTRSKELGDLPKAVWGNAASFECALLADAYSRFPAVECPWSFREDLCYRTFKKLYPDESLMPPREGHHHALFDAMWRAQHLINIVKHVNAPVVANDGGFYTFVRHGVLNTGKTLLGKGSYASPQAVADNGKAVAGKPSFSPQYLQDAFASLQVV